MKGIICLDTEEGASLAELESFCSYYNINNIVRTINRHKLMHHEIMEFFYKNLRNVKEWSFCALQLLILEIEDDSNW